MKNTFLKELSFYIVQVNSINQQFRKFEKQTQLKTFNNDRFESNFHDFSLCEYNICNNY